MDRDTAISHLPPSYAAALALHGHGLDDVIAEQLDIAPEAIPALLSLAEAKLARIAADPISTTPRSQFRRTE